VKLAVITGPTSGIGLAYAQQLAEEGYELLLIGRNQAKLENLKSELSNKTKVDYFVADLSVHSEIIKTANHLKGLDVAVLVNNAGFGSSLPFTENSLE
jgi:short-subunit dehydrogenase